MEFKERPNPKELLEYLKKEELDQQKNLGGRLKIFLGAAPGVGKTYAMLQSAIEELKEGVDVVAGIVETHGRQETELLLKKLEVLPQATINYRGKDLLEFDLDLVFKRAPKLVLVDEMAHSNVTGSRHNKRWQDIMELLDRGIDVYTTINVQHIESLNNVIARLINVVVQETVPDPILERARAIELVDLPPEDLIKRLKEGKVYVSKDIIGLAVDNFFCQDNLIALRELALRVTAEQVNAEELLHRRGESIEKIWPTTERLLICIDSDLVAAKLIRAAFRMAKRLRAQWIAIHVERPNIQLSEEERNNIVRHLHLVEQLGGQTFTIGGTNVAKEIINFSKDYNITRIILGKNSRSNWKEIFKPSLANELVRFCNDLDLHILRGDSKNIKHFTKTNQKFSTYVVNVVVTLTIIVLCMVINFLLYKYLGLSTGLRSKSYLISFFVMLLGAEVIAYLILLIKKQEKFFRMREQRAIVMHLLSKQLANTRGVDQLLKIAVHHISEVFDSEVLALLPDVSAKTHKLVVAHSGKNFKVVLTAKEYSVAEWVYELGQVAGLGTQTLPDNEALYVPLLGSNGSVGVLRVLPKDPNKLLIPEQLHLLENFCKQIAMALEVEKLY